MHLYGYIEHNKAYRFMVIKPNASITVNAVIESIDVIFDENRFSSIPKSNDLIPTITAPSDGQELGNMVEVRKSKWIRKEKSVRSDFFVYLVEGTRDFIEDKIPYVYSIDSDLNSFEEAMESHASFWKEAV